MLGVHRVAWEFAYGPIPDQMSVLHSCDNPPCCNPLHLFLGTAQDNSRDMVAKGRAATGPKGYAKKLTTDDVRRIRELSAAGVRNGVIGPQFGIDKRTVWDIVKRKTWATLEH